MSVRHWITHFREKSTRHETRCTHDQTHFCFTFDWQIFNRIQECEVCFLVNAGLRRQKYMRAGCVCNVFLVMAGASYHQRWFPVHSVPPLVSSASCFHMWAVFLLVQFFCFLETLFFQPELDIVFSAYVQGWNDWLWQKGYLPPSLKRVMASQTAVIYH